jgi:hypothetical protein
MSSAVASSSRAQQSSTAPYLPTDIADNTTNTNQDESELYGMIYMDSSGLDDFSCAPPHMSDARAHVSASYRSADDGFDYQEEEDIPI